MDTIITGGSVVLENAVRRLHVGVAGGRIVALVDGDSAPPAADTRIDADGLVVVPGAIDAHTHFTGAHDAVEDEVAGGTFGAARAGVTTVIEMPHSDPPATSLENFLKKRELFARRSSVDFALWGGLDGRNLDQLPLMHEAGAAAMKGFMCSGRADGEAGDARGLPMLDDDMLREAMRVIAGLGGVIGLHAENHAIIQGRMQALKAAGRSDARAHAEAQPEIVETEAVARAIFLAGEAEVHLHVVHLSSATAAAQIAAARQSQTVTVETCPQYLLLDEEDLVRIGGIARCGPPIRPRATVEALWQSVLGGGIDALTSDHCPYPTALKTVDSIWDAAMGLTGIETATPLFFGAASERGLSLVDFARMTATGPARIFGLDHRKGAIAIGRDADLVLIDPTATGTVESGRFGGLGKWSAFEGMTHRGVVQRTLVRGLSIFSTDDADARPGHGTFVPRANKERHAP